MCINHHYILYNLIYKFTTLKLFCKIQNNIHNLSFAASKSGLITLFLRSIPTPHLHPGHSTQASSPKSIALFKAIFLLMPFITWGIITFSNAVNSGNK